MFLKLFFLLLYLPFCSACINGTFDAVQCQDFWNGWNCSLSGSFLTYLREEGLECFRLGGFKPNCSQSRLLDPCVNLTTEAFGSAVENIFTQPARVYSSVHLLFSAVGISSLQFQFMYVNSLLK